MKHTVLFLGAAILTLALLLAAIVLVSPARAVDESREWNTDMHQVTIHSDNCPDSGVSFDFEDGSIFLTNKNHRGDEIEITEKHELFVNGEKIELTRDQQRTVTRFYDYTDEIVDRAKEIGLEGAKVGVEGAKVGMKAVHGILKAIFTDYTFDDLDEDLDRAAAKVEAKADKLEKRADVIENMADEVEDLYDDMFRDIPALRDLNW